MNIELLKDHLNYLQNVGEEDIQQFSNEQTEAFMQKYKEIRESSFDIWTVFESKVQVRTPTCFSIFHKEKSTTKQELTENLIKNYAKDDMMERARKDIIVRQSLAKAGLLQEIINPEKMQKETLKLTQKATFYLAYKNCEQVLTDKARLVEEHQQKLNSSPASTY